MDHSDKTAQPLRLLSLDGGGILGLSELIILKELMHKIMLGENAQRICHGLPPLPHPPNPCDYFDMICGSNTGGIIALMLGRLRMPVEAAITHYHTLAKEVFSHAKPFGSKDAKYKAKHLESVIKSVVQEFVGNEEEPLMDSNPGNSCKTFVCAKNAYNMNGNIPTLFRTYISHETHVDCKIWEAARATSAAPTFFKPLELGRGQPYIDGGIGCNNPSGVLLKEAKVIFAGRPIGCLVSIGTGKSKVISMGKGVLPTDVVKALEKMATDCETTHQTMMGEFPTQEDGYVRLNVEQGMQDIKLTEWEDGELGKIEAHTKAYMMDVGVGRMLNSLANTMKKPKEQIEQEAQRYEPPLR